MAAWKFLSMAMLGALLGGCPAAVDPCLGYRQAVSTCFGDQFDARVESIIDCSAFDDGPQVEALLICYRDTYRVGDCLSAEGRADIEAALAVCEE